jgi:two-component system response regulator AtoC
MITVSPKMLQFFTQVEKSARTEASILVRGETGTGKELAARAIHALSPRRKAPFYAINCATLSSELMQSELFGHVKGAFTGAIADRKGLFELAHTGTLFLDEVAETPIEVQARLLRVLQERTFTPVGSTVSRTANVRLVSATHRSLRTAVADRAFREDLMYRLRVIPLFLPPLRERGGDIEMLTWRFAEELATLGYRRIEALEGGARDALLSHAWPGNIRELRNVLEYACALGEGERLALGDLTPELRGETSTPDRPSSYRDVERTKILAALERASGQRAAAAKALKMSRSTLWRKAKMLGIF